MGTEAELIAALKAIVDQCEERPRGCTKNSPVILKARQLLNKMGTPNDHRYSQT